MMPAMICAVAPNAMASGRTTCAPCAGKRPALTARNKTGGRGRATNPSAAGFALSVHISLLNLLALERGTAFTTVTLLALQACPDLEPLIQRQEIDAAHRAVETL